MGECFARNVLEFADDKTYWRDAWYVNRNEEWKEWKKTDLTVGTYPKGSAWRYAGPIGAVAAPGHDDCGHGDDDCCTPERPCGRNEGDCDSHDDCEEGLMCGVDNCRGPNFDYTDDCCFSPSK